MQASRQSGDRDQGVGRGIWLNLSPQKMNWLAAMALAILTVAAYWPSLKGDFLYDDLVLVTQSDLIKASDGLYRIWFTTQANDYWPLTNTTFWLEWRLWKTNPTGYHVINLALHLAACFLLWLVLRKLSVPGAYLAARTVCNPSGQRRIGSLDRTAEKHAGNGVLLTFRVVLLPNRSQRRLLIDRTAEPAGQNALVLVELVDVCAGDAQQRLRGGVAAGAVAADRLAAADPTGRSCATSAIFCHYGIAHGSEYLVSVAWLA